MARPMKTKNRLSKAAIESIRANMISFDFADGYKSITLKAARVNAGFTREEVSEIMGVSANTVTRWESGGMIKPDILMQLCRLYKIGPGMLRFGRDDKRDIF